MRKSFICFFVLGMATVCYAQSKNEIALGYAGAYFFDSTGFKINDFANVKFPTFLFTRVFGKHLFANAIVGKYNYRYTNDKDATDYFNYEYRKILTRPFKKIGLGLGFKTFNRIVNFKGSIGLTYQFSGQKLVFIQAYQQPTWTEINFEFEPYKFLGSTASVSIEHIIFRGLFGEFRGDYAKMFRGPDQRQLMLYHLIGFRF